MAKININYDYNLFVEKLIYKEDTGHLFFKKKPNKVAGWIGTHGYREVQINNKSYYCHKIAWVMFYKKQPNATIDHINRIRSDNRIVNLRDVSQRENNWNAKTTSQCFVGSSFCKKNKKWRSNICIKEKQISLGLYKKREEAHCAYIIAYNFIKSGITDKKELQKLVKDQILFGACKLYEKSK